MNKILVLIIVLTLISCKNGNQISSVTIDKNQDPYQIYISLFKENPEFVASNFDYPIGKSNAEGYYNAQKFRKNNHLGDDWNGIGGGNTDLGDPIYAIANGYVSFAKDIKGGWGNVIRVIHQYKGKYYESIYAHCDSIAVKKGDFVKKGALIATIGTANGIYLAHLHLEIRNDIFMDIGGGYANDSSGYLDPTEFIKNN
ncbi:peptidase M23-like protein [Aquimarina sp. MAR_2010_214]|uniref:M23 family metallopeptidase n=1 Tax=Aquimarina sp. MAR_2010_214 TaxID=1250026 RepID=UPI000C705155|nr:M23 family metallopeptidase [Aquimarina sp. MAR_2010_214]PKV52101.1 peptidase M23-like protein [Aquimarina sp. MAR_2010_214]